MSTRGVYGFQIGGVRKLTYNHSDSYPTWLGENMACFIRSHGVEKITEIAKNIILVDPDSKPNKLQIASCKHLANTSVGEGRLDDWYVLLRESQGKPEFYAKGLQYMPDYQTFIGAPDCEWGYIINVDLGTLEVYEDRKLKGSFPLGVFTVMTDADIQAWSHKLEEE